MSKARAWFADPAEFRQLCGDVQSQARDESSQDFAADMMLKTNQHGLDTFLSIKQLEWLCKIADWDVPKRTTSSASDAHD